MKIGNSIPGFKTSAEGLSIQRKRMNLIAENIANADNTRTESGQPYKRKYMIISNEENRVLSNNDLSNSLKVDILEDYKEGEKIFMPNHPDADGEGYVEMSNVNIVQEMVEMIAATRSYEANITAFNASKEIAKATLEI